MALTMLKNALKNWQSTSWRVNRLTG